MAELSLKVGFIFSLERLQILTAINAKLNLLLLNVVVPWFIWTYITWFLNSKEVVPTAGFHSGRLCLSSQAQADSRWMGL